jgi:beta-lactamase regulating signal transducer with metallopeptidase domain
MNAIQVLSAQPWVERLGSTLLHFLWQGVLIAGIYAALRKRSARAGGPNARYLLGCAALAAMAAAPLATWTLLRTPATESAAVSFTAPLAASASTALPGVPAWVAGGVPRAVPAPLLRWVVALWLAGTAAFCVRLAGGWVVAERLRFRLVRPAPSEWQQALDRLKTRIRVSRPVRLLVSALVHAPVVVGWLRPVVLVPVGALGGLPPEQIEALLLHELAHIRRHDYFVNALQGVMEALLFYHPAVWWISSHIRAEREVCCDDVAVSIHGDAVTYARALAELASPRPVDFRAVVAAQGGSLADRIARLLGQPRPEARTSAGPGVVAAAILLAITAFAVFGQPAARPRFEVASIKPSAGQGLRMVRAVPGRLTADAPVRTLIQSAYGVQEFQISGGPDWTSSERYAIEARPAGNATRAEMFLMLQSLLEDRFQLRIHRETKELPVYALAPAKSGLKLAAPREGSCEDPGPDTPPEWAGGRMLPPGQNPPHARQCGSASVRLESSGPVMEGG